MMDEAEATLRELGVAEKSIHLERFNTPGGNVKRAAGVQAEGRTVTIRQDGRDRVQRVAGLRAVQRQLKHPAMTVDQQVTHAIPRASKSTTTSPLVGNDWQLST